MAGILKIHVFVLGLALIHAAAQNASNQPAGKTAAAPSGKLGTKIGVVNIQEAIFTTNEGKKETDALQQRFAPKQAELKGLNDEIENLKKQLQAQGDKLNDEERNNRARVIDSKQRSFSRAQEDAQNEFQQAEQEVINRLGQKMLVVLEKYSIDNGYAAVLDVSGQQSPVLWASQGNTITKDLIDAYNTASPAAAPSKPATPPFAPKKP